MGQHHKKVTRRKLIAGAALSGLALAVPSSALAQPPRWHKHWQNPWVSHRWGNNSGGGSSGGGQQAQPQQPEPTPQPEPEQPRQPEPAPQPAPGGNILWRADHTTGNLSQWEANGGGGIFNSGNGSASHSRDVSRTSGGSARLRVDTGNGGEHGTRLFRWEESRRHAELYYSTWLYFPDRIQVNGWVNVFQFKSRNSRNNDPFWLLGFRNRLNGQMDLDLYDWQNERTYTQNRPLPVGQWVHLEMFYRSAGDNSGRVTVWQDGHQLWDMQNVRTRYSDGDCGWSVNLYGSGLSPSPSVVYVDEAIISTGRMGPGR